ncbi:MAG: P1 family peptidase [Ardenticatenaceae bacterium]|nr:P1 family peptidase [Ardenticatenaceae bacterium]MCB8988902.1 P1 family peptidase [Ardenticatenaceae bacterium]
MQNETKPRARDLGVPFPGTPGSLNAITDVNGVMVGHTTLISGEGKLEVGKGPVRTGVTAVWPRGVGATEGVSAGVFALNGVGEMTGTHLIEEFGAFIGPVLLTNTLSVGVVRDAVITWARDHIADAEKLFYFSLPVVAETWDGNISDAYGQHVRPRHVFAALDGAAGGPVAEGNVGGGTGMSTYEFKGGIGTASRRVSVPVGDYTVGALVQSNFGRREQLLVAGVPVGKEIDDLRPSRLPGDALSSSIIILVATDAPFLPTQLKRLARRAGLGLARTGSTAHHHSGDIFLAFSTAVSPTRAGSGLDVYTAVPDAHIDPFFDAVAYAVEEAIINALAAAETMTGKDGATLHALPHGRLQSILRRYNRLHE